MKVLDGTESHWSAFVWRRSDRYRDYPICRVRLWRRVLRTSTPVSVSFKGSSAQTIGQGQSVTTTVIAAEDPRGQGGTWMVTGPGALRKQNEYLGRVRQPTRCGEQCHSYNHGDGGRGSKRVGCLHCESCGGHCLRFTSHRECGGKCHSELCSSGAIRR